MVIGRLGQLWRLLVASADPDLGALRREAEGEEAKARQLGGSQNEDAAALKTEGGCDR